MRIRYNPEARPELAAWEYYIDEPEKLRGHWAEHFARRQPMVLELGCGKGGFLAQMAPAHPEKNYIALDVKSEMLVLAKRKAEQLEDKQDQEAGVLGLDKTGKGYIELDFFNLFWIFVVCCFLGLIIETVYHMIIIDPGVYEDRAGLLYGPFSPIYGVGGVMITIALNRFHKSNPVVVFLAAAFIGAAFEYLVSWWMETSFGITAWDYTGTFLNIDGRTNFKFFCMWGCLGIVWLRWILPKLLALINRIPWNWRYSLTMVATALMLVDCGLTLASLDRWFERQADMGDAPVTAAIEGFCDEHYDDEFMENLFQTMSIDPDEATRVG